MSAGSYIIIIYATILHQKVNKNLMTKIEELVSD